MSDEEVSLVRIGAGSFAQVFVWQGRNSVVLKIVKDGSGCPELLREFQLLESVARLVSSPGIIFSIVTPCAYYASFAIFKREMALQHGSLEELDDVACLYTMERVWPVPRNLSLLIRERYFPPEFRNYEKGFIARVYLGKRRVLGKTDRPRRFFNPNNWPLDADSLEELRLPVVRIAMDMGRVLARLHFLGNCDARDIEFVLGGDPLNPFNKFKLYCMDFNQVRELNQDDEDSFVSNVADSFLMNDPYFPRPAMSFWEEFRLGYLSEVCSEKEHALAIKALQEIINRVASQSNRTVDTINQ